MSTKYIVAAAALATIAITQTEATKFSIDRIKHRDYRLRPVPSLLDEEQADWNFNAGIQGGAGGKPQWNVGIGAKWDEEQGSFEGPCHGRTCISEEIFEPCHGRTCIEQQKLRLSKVVKGIKKANNVVNKAQAIGLLDEESFDGPCHGRTCISQQVSAPCHGRTCVSEEVSAPCHGRTCVSEEVSGPCHGRTCIEQQKLRLNKIVKGIKRANNVVNRAQAIGLLDDEEQIDWSNPGCYGRTC